MRAKITAYNFDSQNEGCTDFSLNCYWGNNYKNVFYLCGDFGRSTFEDIIETETDVTGQSERTQNTSIERFNLSLLATTPLLQFLKAIDKHDVKTIELIDTGAVYNIKNIDIDDTGEILTPNNLVYINFEDEPITKVSSNIYTVSDQKKAFWDNNNDGTADINGDMIYDQPNNKFTSHQLYFENDGTTPATSGNIKMFVYAESVAGTENLLGIFQGAFGDLFTDSTKWQSTQNLYNYFSVGSSVGHTNVIEFFKQTFANDNGYQSDETENRAVKLHFDLSIDNGTIQRTTQELVYTIFGAFHRAEILNVTSGAYGATVLSDNVKNSLDTFQDIRTEGSTTTLISSYVQTGTTAFSNEYTFDTANTNELGFGGAIVTAGGYTGKNFRASISRDNFCFGPSSTNAIGNFFNVLNFTSGTSPYLVRILWNFERINSTYPKHGEVTSGSAAQILLNGSVVNNGLSITPTTTQISAFQDITLTNTDINTIKFTVPTTTGFDIFTEFQVQLKPYF
tara:strand:+ start:13013 stop:14539 length:1527 start_codon:yes stop_codon:yes gene_type:complete